MVSIGLPGVPGGPGRASSVYQVPPGEANRAGGRARAGGRRRAHAAVDPSGTADMIRAPSPPRKHRLRPPRRPLPLWRNR